MAVHKEVIHKIKNDLNNGPNRDVLQLSESEIDNFWHWFGVSAQKFEVSKQVTSKRIGGSIRLGRCFGNSQTIALEYGKEYCEGFMKLTRSSEHTPRFILHGFNAFDWRAEDFTVLNNPKAFKGYNGELPDEYYGIIIPHDLIEEHNKNHIEASCINIPHLIDKYFKSINR